MPNSNTVLVLVYLCLYYYDSLERSPTKRYPIVLFGECLSRSGPHSQPHSTHNTHRHNLNMLCDLQSQVNNDFGSNQTRHIADYPQHIPAFHCLSLLSLICEPIMRCTERSISGCIWLAMVSNS